MTLQEQYLAVIVALNSPILRTIRIEHLGRLAPRTWVDDRGRTWRTPSAEVKRMKWKYPLHWRLRAFVFHRDGYRCQSCGRRSRRTPKRYTGHSALWITYEPRNLLIVDHLVSLKNGGSNHPLNLRACCERCNLQKVGWFDTPLAAALGAAGLDRERLRGP